jgi:hypothetical protein
MRKIFWVSLCLLLISPVFASLASAQTAGEEKAAADKATDDAVQLLRQDIRSERKQLVAANLPLTDTEATKFWPVYDRYTAEVTKLGDSRYALVKEYAQNYKTLTDAQADTLIKRFLASDEAVAQLRTKWIVEFEKVISSKKTAMYFQIDRRLGMLIDLQIASEIPLVRP